MALSKKEKLIRSLRKLLETKTLPSLVRSVINSLVRSIEKMNFSKEPDLNATLTRLIYLKLLSAHPSIMNDPNSNMLKLFCEQEIGPIKPPKPSLKP